MLASAASAAPQLTSTPQKQHAAVAATAPILAIPHGPRLLLSRVLGHGSFGTVYHATTTTHPPVSYAVKHVSLDTLSPAQRHLQRMETLNHGRVHAHENIATLHAAVTSRDQANVYLVLEYCDQPDLFDFLRDGKALVYPNPDAVLCELFAQICDAVEHCHKRGVFHRDLKPENVLLTTSPIDGTLSVRLADFGLACTREAASRGCGSTVYLSPESHTQNLFALNYDPAAADVWSLGVLLCHMAAGVSPWREATPTDPGFAFHLAHPHGVGLDLLMHLPRALTSVLERVFVLDPGKRLSVAELRDAVLTLGRLRPETPIHLDVDQESCPPTPTMGAVMDAEVCCGACHQVEPLDDWLVQDDGGGIACRCTACHKSPG